MNDQIYIQHRFTIKQGDQQLQDAIVLPQEEYNKLTAEDIETQKQERFNSWIDSINNPPPESVLSKAEQIAQIDKDIASLDEQKALLVSQKAELGGK